MFRAQFKFEYVLSFLLNYRTEKEQSLFMLNK